MIQPVYRVMTSSLPIDASTTIEQGMAVALTSPAGKATKCAAAGRCIGIAADCNRSVQPGMFVDRVSDFGNETYASGEIAYYSHGEFWVDVDDGTILFPNGTAIPGVVASAPYNPGDTLVVSSTNGVLAKAGAGGAGSQVVATVLQGNTSLDSGIPGEYEPDSVNYVNDANPRTWVRIKLEL
jgi:hypothetical protein